MSARIRNLVSLLVIIFLAAAAARAQQSQGEAPAPRAVLTEVSFDFGDVYKGEIISQIFYVKNEGNADLVIRDFVTGCGCEVTSWDKIIPPGKEGKAQLEINTSTQVGQIIKPATLRTNDPDRPNIVLTLTANVLTSPDGGPVQGVTIRQGRHIGPVFLGPDNRVGLNLAAGQKGKTEFTVTVEKGPLKVLRLEDEQKNFSLRLETIEEGKSYKVIAEPITTDKAGSFIDQVRVITDSRALPSFPVYLYLVVRPK